MQVCLQLLVRCREMVAAKKTHEERKVAAETIVELMKDLKNELDTFFPHQLAGPFDVEVPEPPKPPKVLTKSYKPMPKHAFFCFE